jgi:Protein of unknown function (DUF1194)
MGQHGKHRPLVGRGFILALLLATQAQAQAQAQDCRLALLLGVDVSASVDEAEHAIQRSGLIAALLSPQVQEPLFAGPGTVALGIYEWSGRFQQDMIAPWRMIRNEADLLVVIEQLQAAPRSTGEYPTALGYALGYAAEQFTEAPPCLFQTLDISGDGQNNDGFTPDLAYQHFPLDNVTVNGLAIGGASHEIREYYERELIRGPGSFVEYALNHDEFEDAMRRKLERELRVMILGSL